jgi:hypothetical protein
VIYNISDINNGCKINVVYEPPEDGLVKAEIKSENIVHFVVGVHSFLYLKYSFWHPY